MVSEEFNKARESYRVNYNSAVDQLRLDTVDSLNFAMALANLALGNAHTMVWYSASAEYALVDILNLRLQIHGRLFGYDDITNIAVYTKV